MIKAAFFDLDDTLCDDTGAWIACSRKAAAKGVATLAGNVDAEEVAQRFLAISERYWMGLDYTTETRPLHELRASQFAEALGEAGITDYGRAHEVMAAEYSRIRSREIALFPDALSTLDGLRGLGVHLTMITNGLASTHVEKVAHLGLEAAFDQVIIAGVIDLWKPDPRIFAHALDICRAEPHEAIMVGDNIVNDVGGAQRSGIPAFWYNPRGLAAGAGDPVPQLGELRALRDMFDNGLEFGVA